MKKTFLLNQKLFKFNKKDSKKTQRALDIAFRAGCIKVLLNVYRCDNLFGHIFA